MCVVTFFVRFVAIFVLKNIFAAIMKARIIFGLIGNAIGLAISNSTSAGVLVPLVSLKSSGENGLRLSPFQQNIAAATAAVGAGISAYGVHAAADAITGISGSSHSSTGAPTPAPPPSPPVIDFKCPIDLFQYNPPSINGVNLCESLRPDFQPCMCSDPAVNPGADVSTCTSRSSPPGGLANCLPLQEISCPVPLAACVLMVCLVSKRQK